MDLILFGIQGSGKGTQAKILAEKYGFSIFETGAELRAIRAGDSELGRTVREIIDRGDLVPNTIVMEIVAHFLMNVSAETRVLFDGLPRSLEQKGTFDALLQSKNREVRVIFLTVPRDEAIARMLERGRADDTQEVIERRLQNYETETLPVIEAYEQEGRMTQVNGFQPIEAVSSACYTAVEA